MGWYGQTGFAFLLSVPASVFTFLVLFYGLKREMSNTSAWYKLAGGIAISAVLLMMIFFVWHEYQVWIMPE